MGIEMSPNSGIQPFRDRQPISERNMGRVIEGPDGLLGPDTIYVSPVVAPVEIALGLLDLDEARNGSRSDVLRTEFYPSFVRALAHHLSSKAQVGPGLSAPYLPITDSKGATKWIRSPKNFPRKLKGDTQENLSYMIWNRVAGGVSEKVKPEIDRLEATIRALIWAGCYDEKEVVVRFIGHVSSQLNPTICVSERRLLAERRH